MTYGRFLEDLNQKQWVGLILDSEEVIQGFSTIAINPKGCGTAEYNIIFSGDTIVNPVHWGGQVLMKGWAFTIGQLVATHPEKDWYWYLISKGHRTYMNLPLFFLEYFPSLDAIEIPKKLQHIAHEVSEILYPDFWQKEKEIIHFPNNRGALAPELAQGTYKKAKSKYVAYFLEKNPGFYQGDELVCIAPLRINNFVRTSKEFVTWGYQHPLVFPGSTFLISSTASGYGPKKKHHVAYMRTRGQMAAVQQEKLQHYLLSNQNTAFGRDHRFESLKNYGDFCLAVPIIEDFEAIRDYIDAIASGKQKVLTDDQALCFESTSGSSAAAKWIPYTKTLKTEFQKALAVWMHETAKAYPGAFYGTAYWSISPPMKKREITKGGLLVGMESDTDYLQSWVGKLLSQAFAVNQKMDMDDPHHFYLQLSSQLLACRRLSFISVWSPNYFLQLHDFMVENWEEILDGKTIPKKRKRELMDLDHFVWKKAFPNLELVSCWTEAQSGIWLTEVKQRLGNVPIQPKGLLSTEGVVSVPLKDNSKALAYTSHFFEFRHVDSREVFLAHQLELAETYEVIITTGGGLYRYNTKDKVKITGHQDGVPLIDFLGKGQEVSDLVGEKVAASAISPLFQEMVEASEGTIKSLFLYPVLCGQQVTYQVLVETGFALDIDAIGKKVERKLLENPYYQQGMAAGQLLPLKAVIKPIGFRKEAFERYRQKKGIKDGDIKLPLILPLGLLDANPTIVHG